MSERMPQDGPESLAGERVHLRIERLGKRFGDTWAVREVSLDIGEREIFALLGSSGCGKSTLLRMIAGLETPSCGRILLDGEDLAAVPAHRRPTNMMFQSYALFPHMTVAGNVAFGLRQLRPRMARAAIAARVDEMLELVQMRAYAGRRPHALSGGQQQRVALARSLAREPRLLLLDEPLAALDKRIRQQTQFELVGLIRRVGVTCILVTHDQEEAMTMADRIAVMDKGEVMQVATPAEIYEAPVSRFVANFIGNVNMMEGTVAERDDTLVKIVGASGAEIKVGNAGQVLPGSRVAFAIRPEKIKVSSKEPAAGTPNVLSGEIYDLAYLGDMTVYHVRLGDGQVVKASALNASRSSEDPLTWHDKAWISFAPDAGLVLTR
ncbi:MAG: ABC transporter ATP-binding protein [Thauera sp.]|nr:ABC transporter ATP-binding protein [Thauera sp.]